MISFTEDPNGFALCMPWGSPGLVGSLDDDSTMHRPAEGPTQSRFVLGDVIEFFTDAALTDRVLGVVGPWSTFGHAGAKGARILYILRSDTPPTRPLENDDLLIRPMRVYSSPLVFGGFKTLPFRPIGKVPPEFLFRHHPTNPQTPRRYDDVFPAGTNTAPDSDGRSIRSAPFVVTAILAERWSAAHAGGDRNGGLFWPTPLVSKTSTGSSILYSIPPDLGRVTFADGATAPIGGDLLEQMLFHLLGFDYDDNDTELWRQVTPRSKLSTLAFADWPDHEQLIDAAAVLEQATHDKKLFDRLFREALEAGFVAHPDNAWYGESPTKMRLLETS